MSEELGEAAHSFTEQPATQPRDQAGRFAAVAERPEPMFGLRPIEGDPLTGDTRDGGEDSRLQAREREIADGRVERSDVQQRRTNVAEQRDAAGEVEHQGTEIEPEDIWSISAESGDLPRPDQRASSEGDEPLSARDAEPDAEGERFEVTADGETFHVTLAEALRGYSREQTFHKRLAQLSQAQGELQSAVEQLRNNWGQWQKARTDYEEDLANLIPSEPNWDQEFARDPAVAHATQKVFQALYTKLNQSRQGRIAREAQASAEEDRRVQDYAVKGFSKFVMDNNIPDEPTLKKNLQSMRRTASAAGFSEYEVATVYDPRMLGVLLKASKYDRMMAARPRAVIPGKGRTLTPGAATPLGGNAARKGLDEALRRQASSGRLEDTAEVFRRLL
jgi:hypothetical protein